MSAPPMTGAAGAADHLMTALLHLAEPGRANQHDVQLVQAAAVCGIFWQLDRIRRVLESGVRT